MTVQDLRAGPQSKRANLKIILTVHQFLPDHFSGTETLVYETAKELLERGHAVKVITGFPTKKKLADDQRFDEYTYAGIPISRFHHSYTPMGGQTNIQELVFQNRLFGAFFKTYLGREQPDVVHFFHLSRLSASAIDVCEELRLPTVFTPTDFWFICPTAQLQWPGNQACPGPNAFSINCLRHTIQLTQQGGINTLVQRLPDWLLGFLVRVIKVTNLNGQYPQLINALVRRKDFLLERLNRIDRILVPTQVMMELLVRNGMDAGRATSLPFGINTSYCAGRPRPAPSQTLRLGYIGTISEPKGVHIFLEAVRRVTNLNLEIKIYGQLNDFPAYTTRLQAILDNDPRVTFCGTFPNHQIGRIFSELDALVVPSLWRENSPLVVYSAQAAKCPVIASNVAGISQIIENHKNGILFEPGNVAELAGTLKELAENKTRLLEMSNHAKAPSSIQNYVDELLNIYHQLT